MSAAATTSVNRATHQQGSQAITANQQHAILRWLEQVAAERRLRDADGELAERVGEVKRWQHERFEATYADLLNSPRYAAAARFFLDDLYGPVDFTKRDDQFARVVPALVRLFPRDIVDTVAHLAELHAMSEQLDTQMARELQATYLDTCSYGEAWRSVGQADLRARQIELMESVGRALDRYTRKPLMRQTLRLMRGPAEATGLAALQSFLEHGFDAFRAMKGADGFLQIIASRESSMADKLFKQS